MNFNLRRAVWDISHLKTLTFVVRFFIIKPTRCTNFTNVFWRETLHVSDSSSVHHQEFIHFTLSSGICRTVPSWSCWKAVYKPVWHVPLLSAQWINSWWWADELSETCRVPCRNEFVKLVHLFGFIVRKFVNDARSHERRICGSCLVDFEKISQSNMCLLSGNPAT